MLVTSLVQVGGAIRLKAERSDIRCAGYSSCLSGWSYQAKSGEVGHTLCWLLLLSKWVELSG